MAPPPPRRKQSSLLLPLVLTATTALVSAGVYYYLASSSQQSSTNDLPSSSSNKRSLQRSSTTPDPLKPNILILISTSGPSSLLSYLPSPLPYETHNIFIFTHCPDLATHPLSDPAVAASKEARLWRAGCRALPGNVPKEMVVPFKEMGAGLEGMVKQFSPEGVWVEGRLAGEEIRRSAEGGWVGLGGVVVWVGEGGKGSVEEVVGAWKGKAGRRVKVVEGAEVGEVWREKVGA